MAVLVNLFCNLVHGNRCRQDFWTKLQKAKQENSLQQPLTMLQMPKVRFSSISLQTFVLKNSCQKIIVFVYQNCTISLRMQLFVLFSHQWNIKCTSPHAESILSIFAFTTFMDIWSICGVYKKANLVNFLIPKSSDMSFDTVKRLFEAFQ